jgi:hypothetical protein
MPNTSPGSKKKRIFDNQNGFSIINSLMSGILSYKTKEIGRQE